MSRLLSPVVKTLHVKIAQIKWRMVNHIYALFVNLSISKASMLITTSRIRSSSTFKIRMYLLLAMHIKKASLNTIAREKLSWCASCVQLKSTMTISKSVKKLITKKLISLSIKLLSNLKLLERRLKSLIRHTPN